MLVGGPDPSFSPLDHLFPEGFYYPKWDKRSEDFLVITPNRLYSLMKVGYFLYENVTFIFALNSFWAYRQGEDT